MPAQKFRKKPVEIEAMQWDGTAAGASPIIDWILANGDRSAHWDEPHDEIRNVLPDGTEQGCPASPGGLFINTLEGTMRADKEDWIIRGIKDEFYPCKPDIFAATYASYVSNQDWPKRIVADYDKKEVRIDDVPFEYPVSDDVPIRAEVLHGMTIVSIPILAENFESIGQTE
ncbi:MAG: hypothetical protein WBD41_14230 [Rhodococcus sp. (in: high G+C Gram-positive bacteria)]